MARHFARIVPALALLVLLVPLWKGVELADAALRAKQDADAALAVATQLQEHPTDAAALAAAPPALRDVHRSFSALQAQLEPLQPLLDLTRGLPTQASWPADLPDALLVTAALADVGATVATPLAAAAPAEEAGTGRLARYLMAATTLGPAMPEIVSRVEATEPALNRLHGRPLGGPLQPLGPIVDRLVEHMPQVRQAPELLRVLGSAAGMDRPRTYILLGQNREELRASGGFIGTAGSFTLDKGVLTSFEYGSSYLVDMDVSPPPAPPPMVRHLGLGGWYLRDANWWPDFPASATQVEQAWRRAGHPPVDGVIAIDNAVVEALLGAIGPLEVPERGTVSAENFEQFSVEALYGPGDDFASRTSSVFSTFGRTFVARLLALSPAEMASVGRGLIELLDTKHVQLAFKDPDLAALAAARQWDGAVPPLSADSLYVVDTTVSYGKTYRFVRTQGSLHVEIGADGRVAHELALGYRNVYPDGLLPWMPAAMVGGDTFDLTTGRIVETPGFWGNWLRVYLPPGARDVVVEGLVEQGPPQAEFGRTVVAGYLPLAPGQQRTVQVRYVTSAEVVGDEVASSAPTYRVFLQKQAGLVCRPLSMRVSWPQGASARAEACPRADRWVELTAGTARDESALSTRAS